MITQPGSISDRARFETFVFATIFKNEGGDKVYSDEATGEFSKFGISLKFLRGLRPAATKEDILSLDLKGAEALYYAHFWTGPRLYQLDDDGVAFRVFDLGVNNGSETAIRLLQRALLALEWPISVDGLLGPGTASIANRVPAPKLLPAIIDQATSRYKFIALKDASSAKNLTGWLERLARA